MIAEPRFTDVSRGATNLRGRSDVGRSGPYTGSYMTAARKSESEKPSPPTTNQSGEHVIGLDAMIRRSIEIAYSEVRDEESSDPQTTARMNPFDLEVALAEAKPSVPPELPDPGSAVVSLSDIPPAAVEIDRTK